jgi:hypothetical protein
VKETRKLSSKVILLRKDVDFGVNGVEKWMGCHEMMFK